MTRLMDSRGFSTLKELAAYFDVPYRTVRRANMRGIYPRAILERLADVKK
jgi:hypothetical protein